MNWTQVDIYTTTEAIDLLSSKIQDLGIRGCMVQDAQDFQEFLEQKDGRWDYLEDGLMELAHCETCITVYLPEDGQGAETLSALRDMLAQLRAADPEHIYGRLEMQCSGIREEDWANNWKAYFKPLPVGQRLLICPSWEEPGEHTGRAVLRIDPGMAFGTGTHETTSLCLETLDSMVKGGERVLDIGTGSGILAIAALKLGADSAEGVDIDPMCVRTAGENAERNGVAEHFTVLVGDLSDKASGKYNIITANIVAAAILSLAPHVPVLMAPGARFIASGIIDTRKDEVLAGLRAAGLEPVEIKEKRGWV